MVKAFGRRLLHVIRRGVVRRTETAQARTYGSTFEHSILSDSKAVLARPTNYLAGHSPDGGPQDRQNYKYATYRGHRRTQRCVEAEPEHVRHHGQHPDCQHG